MYSIIASNLTESEVHATICLAIKEVIKLVVKGVDFIAVADEHYPLKLHFNIIWRFA
ncbi:13111_t:CDS:2 [Rhizophagus irregularis]|nr:13111_t:CDS:2 [Rhizophagus irregularis]